MISAEEAVSLHANIDQAMQNPYAKEWFTRAWDDVKTEAEIITSSDIRRPDRVMIEGGRAVVVDYKFGHIKSKTHIKQVNDYIEILNQMGIYSEIKGYVWYITLGEVVAVTK